MIILYQINQCECQHLTKMNEFYKINYLEILKVPFWNQQEGRQEIWNLTKQQWKKETIKYWILTIRDRKND